MDETKPLLPPRDDTGPSDLPDGHADEVTGAGHGELVPHATAHDDWHDEWEDTPPSTATRDWRQELPRWLATLDAPSTRREYEKAVRYFFETAGVPGALSELTYDLLLAYRGSLARRAERGARRTPPAGTGGGAPRLASGIQAGTLPDAETTGSNDPAGDRMGDEDTRDGARRAGPLAPATANLRITALRRFLLHCLLWDHLPQLSTDRVAAALRRLRIERRRPYQVLAEPEWEAFLAAARRPGIAHHARAPQPDLIVERRNGGRTHSDEGDLDRGPWGTPRAVRRRLASEQQDVAGFGVSASAVRGVARGQSSPVKSRAGLTGRRTAMRDHALLALALATGLRAVELCALDVGDLQREWHGGREEWWLILPDEKTKGQRGGRTLPLGTELARTLLDYIVATGRKWERAQDRATPLFLSGRRHAPSGAASGHGVGSQRLSTPHVRRIVDRVEAQWATQAGANEDAGGALLHSTGRAISPHALRHSTAVALLEGNELTGRPPASVEHVRGWLGHFDIRTTQGYLAHVDSRRHRRPFALDPVRSEGEGVAGSDSPEDTRG